MAPIPTPPPCQPTTAGSSAHGPRARRCTTTKPKPSCHPATGGMATCGGDDYCKMACPFSMETKEVRLHWRRLRQSSSGRIGNPASTGAMAPLRPGYTARTVAHATSKAVFESLLIPNPPKG